MAYTALYRKFRPITFGEMVGQEHITRTLKNQIIAGRVGHAYLFNGGRGTGKTSAAKVLARAINCLNSKDGEPCNECEICKAAINGSLTDIVEMDAASNNGVDDIRQIRDEVNFLPTKAKYRVYIIDEVHMLSTGAFNALLKTLEEPPEHVKFILATTEPQKLPATILSRCQRFDFKKISEEDIEKRLEIVCKESNIEITKEALKIISQLAEGAMRDALSILERCLQDGDTKIEEEKVKDLVGIPKFTYINNLTKAIVEKNTDNALNSIDEILKEGKDLQNVLWELIKYIRDILLYKTSKNASIYSKEEIKEIEVISKIVEKDRLLSIIYELSDLENEMKKTTQKIILFQVSVLKLCNKNINYNKDNQNSNEVFQNIDNKQIDQLKNKIIELENKINKIASNNEVVINKKQQNVENYPRYLENSENKTEDKNLETKPKIQQMKTIKVGEGVNSWGKIVSDLKQEGKIMLYTNLLNSQANEINDMTVGISFPKGLTSFGKTILQKSENINELEKRVSMEFGKPMKIKIIEQNVKIEKNKTETNNLENLVQDLDLPFNIIEE
ncbi:MAG: DNA polymerase III subunit gamma/tau [Clostridiaceae bacterium]|nr:DNA polymerase III subunit gamma/tau [Clostridiaceae bacterium]